MIVLIRFLPDILHLKLTIGINIRRDLNTNHTTGHHLVTTDIGGKNTL